MKIIIPYLFIYISLGIAKKKKKRSHAEVLIAEGLEEEGDM